MSKADKAGEPSMDEILASIRKIIAEEPVGARKAASTEAPAPEVLSKSSQGETLGKLGSSIRPNTKAELDGPARDESSSKQRLAAPLAVTDKPAPSRDPLKPFFPEVARAGDVSADAPPSTAAAQSVDFGAIVPRRPGDSLAESPAGLPVERRPQSGRLPEWLARSSSSASQSGRLSGPLPPPSEPTRLPARDAMPSASAFSEPANLRGSAAVSIPPPPGVVVDAPSKSALQAGAKPGTGESSRGPAAGGSSEGHAIGPAAAVKSGSPEGAVAVAQVGASPMQDPGAMRPGGVLPAGPLAATAKSAPATANDAAKGDVEKDVAPTVKAVGSNGLANGASEPFGNVTVANHTTVQAETMGPRSDRPVPVAEPTAAVAKPAALGERAKPARPAAPADLMPTAAAAGGVRTLEDTVVDLLRPMIRQWLDDNMPRMVEKALRIELAQSVKPKIEQPKH